MTAPVVKSFEHVLFTLCGFLMSLQPIAEIISSKFHFMDDFDNPWILFYIPTSRSKLIQGEQCFVKECLLMIVDTDSPILKCLIFSLPFFLYSLNVFNPLFQVFHFQLIVCYTALLSLVSKIYGTAHTLTFEQSLLQSRATLSSFKFEVSCPCHWWPISCITCIVCICVDVMGSHLLIDQVHIDQVWVLVWVLRSYGLSSLIA